jgi:hypothetical protein
MSDEDYKRGRLDVVKQVVTAHVGLNISMLTDEGMPYQEAIDYIHNTLETFARVPGAFSKMQSIVADIADDARNEHFIAKHLTPPPKKND